MPALLCPCWGLGLNRSHGFTQGGDNTMEMEPCFCNRLSMKETAERPLESCLDITKEGKILLRDSDVIWYYNELITHFQKHFKSSKRTDLSPKKSLDADIYLKESTLRKTHYLSTVVTILAHPVFPHPASVRFNN